MRIVVLRMVGVLCVVALVLGGIVVMRRPEPARKRRDPRTVVTDHVRYDRPAVQGVGRLVPYQGKRFAVDVAFNYPKNWVVGELEGTTRRYRQIIIHGPRNAEDTYTTSLVIGIAPIQSAEPYTSLAHMISSLRARYTQAPNAHGTFVDRSTQVGGLPSWELGATFTTRVPISNKAAREVTVSQCDMLLEHNGLLYQFSFSADIKEYPTYKGVFEEFLKSVRWL